MLFCHATRPCMRPPTPRDSLRRPGLRSCILTKGGRIGRVLLHMVTPGRCTQAGTDLPMLGWIVESINMTITLPPHRVARLKEILSSICCSQRRVGIYKWHHVLRKLRFMALALPKTRGCSAKCRNTSATLKAKGSRFPQALMKPCQTSDS